MAAKKKKPKVPLGENLHVRMDAKLVELIDQACDTLVSESRSDVIRKAVVRELKARKVL